MIILLSIPQVRYANEHDIPFIARSGGHGATESLASAKNAIQIDFRKLNQVKVSEDGKTATIGGGARVKEVVDILIESGKQTGELTHIDSSIFTV